MKTKKTTHPLEFTKGSYRSATEGSEPDWSGTYQVHGGRGTIHLELYTDEGFDIASPSGGNSFEVTYRPQETRRAFAAGNKGGFRIADSSCESGHFVRDESAAIPLRGSFDLHAGRK